MAVWKNLAFLALAGTVSAQNATTTAAPTTAAATTAAATTVAATTVAATTAPATTAPAGNGTMDAHTHAATTATPPPAAVFSIKMKPVLDLGDAVTVATFNAANDPIKGALCGTDDEPRGDLTKGFCDAVTADGKAMASIFSGANAAAKALECFEEMESTCVAEAPSRRLSEERRLAGHAGGHGIAIAHNVEAEVAQGNNQGPSLAALATAVTAITASGVEAEIQAATVSQLTTSLGAGGALAVAAVAAGIQLDPIANITASVTVPQASGEVVTAAPASSTSGAFVATGVTAVLATVGMLLF